MGKLDRNGTQFVEVSTHIVKNILKPKNRAFFTLGWRGSETQAPEQKQKNYQKKIEKLAEKKQKNYKRKNIKLVPKFSAPPRPFKSN